MKNPTEEFKSLTIPLFISDYKMTPTAYVLIETEIGAENEILERLKKIDSVKEAVEIYSVYGNIIARVHKETMDELKETITWEIRRLDKVRTTSTQMVVEDSNSFIRDKKGRTRDYKP